MHRKNCQLTIFHIFITSSFYTKILLHLRLKRGMPREFCLICRKDLPFCSPYAHLFFDLCNHRQQYRTVPVMTSVLSANDRICPATRDLLRPRKIPLSLGLLHRKILFPALKIIPEYTHLAFPALLNDITLETNIRVRILRARKTNSLRDRHWIVRRGDKQIQIRKQHRNQSIISINLIYQFGEQGKAETCASLSAILPQVKDSDTKQIVSGTLKKLNALSEETCAE